MMPNIESSQKLMCLIHLELLEHLLTITLSILHNIFAFVFIAHKLTVCILVYVATTYPLLRAYCGFRYQTMPRAYVPDLHGVVRIPVTLTQSILHHGKYVSAILGHTSTARLLVFEPTSYVLWFHLP